MSNDKKVRTNGTPSQLSLLERPQPITEGQLAHVSPSLRAALATAIKGCALSRYHIAAAVSELMARDLSKDMLDKYCAESAEAHRLPAELVPALCVVTGSRGLLEILAEATGCTLVSVERSTQWSVADLRQGMLRVVTELGEAAETLEKSLRDGTLTPSEAGRCRKELRDLISAAIAVHDKLNQAA
ncbi:phage regulatory CII family protein [Candidatus Nitrospira bockiana]